MVELVIDSAKGEVACASGGHPAAAARAAGRHRRGDRARAGSRSGSTRRRRTRPSTADVPAGRDRRRVHGRGRRGAARRRAVRRSSVWTRCCRSSARCRRRRSRRPRSPRAGSGPKRRADGRLRRSRDQAVRAVAVNRPPRSRGARLRRRHRLARDRDRRLSAARAVLRLVDDRLGEPDRDRARRARVRLLARRPLADRRPEPRLLGLIVLAAAVWVAITPFVARPFLDAAVGNLDDASAGAVIGSFFAVLLLFAPAVVAARDGLAVRDPARDHRRRDRRCGGGPLLRPLDRRLACSAPSCRR